MFRPIDKYEFEKCEYSIGEKVENNAQLKKAKLKIELNFSLNLKE